MREMNLQEATAQKLTESSGVDWSYYDKPEIKEVENKYLLDRGEGDTKATQTITAISKLVYRWYNDGDRYDGYSQGGEDVTDYANWLSKYIPGAKEILQNTKSDISSYEETLKALTDKYLTMEYLDKLNEQLKQGSVYECDGPFVYQGWDDTEEDWDEDDNEDYYEDMDDLDESKEQLFNESTQQLTFEEAVLDSYNHFVNDLGELPSIDDIYGDVEKNYEGIIDDSDPKNSEIYYKDIMYVLNHKDLDYIEE